MKISIFYFLFALLLTSCGTKGAQLDKKVEIEFIQIMVYHAKPTILDGDLAKVSPQADAYWKVVSHWMPGTPQSFNFRSGLAWLYCKWSMYREASIMLGGDQAGAAKHDETLRIYMSLLNGDPPERSRQIIESSRDQFFLLFSRRALLAMVNGDLSPAIDEASAFKLNADERQLFDSILFLDKLLIKTIGPAKYVKSMEPVNRAALALFLSGKDWGAYIVSLKAGGPNYRQTMLFDDMTAIMGENKKLYTIEQNDQKRAFWLSKLNDIKGVLSGLHDNQLTWVNFLIDSGNQ